MIETQQGRDMTRTFTEAATANGISLRLAIGVAYAESKLNERAQRVGIYTKEALAAEARGDMVELQRLINLAWQDVSYGIAQRIIPYHYAGDRSQSVANCLAVRAAVFADPDRDIREMCAWLRDDYQKAGAADLARLGGDRELGACVIYNAGHWPAPTEAYWTTHAGNLKNYREALAKADEIIAELWQDEKPLPQIGVPSVTIEEKAAAMTTLPDGTVIDRLGNGGVPYSPVCEWETSAGTMRFQQFWLAGLLEYPVPPTEDNPDGRDVSTIPEGTLSDADRARFRG